jgi:hypothetical protein
MDVVNSNPLNSRDQAKAGSRRDRETRRAVAFQLRRMVEAIGQAASQAPTFGSR